jgi:cytochrome c oxidase subunit 3
MEVKVGQVKTEVGEERKKKRKRLSSSIGSGSSGKGGNGGGGDDPGGKDSFEDIQRFQPNKLRVGMWFLLVVVIMTFSGLITAYIFLATNKTAEWKTFSLPFQVWISTALIFLSTLTIEIARRKFNQNQQLEAKKWLLATTILGAAFISSQLLVWIRLLRLGIYVESNPYAGLFYILTIVHAVHVLGGIIGLGYLVLRSWNKAFDEEEILRRQTSATVLSWYWHTIDGLWIVLLVLLAFYR